VGEEENRVEIMLNKADNTEKRVWCKQTNRGVLPQPKMKSRKKSKSHLFQEFVAQSCADAMHCVHVLLELLFPCRCQHSTYPGPIQRGGF